MADIKNYGCLSCHARINRAFLEAEHLPLNVCSRYILMSDCHRGTGTENDNFLKNQHLYYAALDYYFTRGFYYLELGDGEELWENRSMRRIEECHSNVYCKFEEFAKRCRITRIYGNHNMELKSGLGEAVILDNQEGGRDICILHGHQADFFNSVCWRLSRFLVRYVWKPLERFGVNDPTSAARNYRKTQRYENCLVRWTRNNNCYLAAGHSHRPRLSEKDELYLNTGSCVHPWGITGIEIENMKLTLIKWTMATRADMTLYVAREVLAGPVEIT